MHFAVVVLVAVSGQLFTYNEKLVFLLLTLTESILLFGFEIYFHRLVVRIYHFLWSRKPFNGFINVEKSRCNLYGMFNNGYHDHSSNYRNQWDNSILVFAWFAIIWTKYISGLSSNSSKSYILIWCHPKNPREKI